MAAQDVQRNQRHREAAAIEQAANKLRRDVGPAIALSDIGEGPPVSRIWYHVAGLLDSATASVRRGDLSPDVHRELLALSSAIQDEPSHWPVGSSGEGARDQG